MTTRLGGTGRATRCAFALIAASLFLGAPASSGAAPRGQGGTTEPFRHPVSIPRPPSIGTPRIGAPTGAPLPAAAPRVVGTGVVSGAARAPGANTPPQQIATYPRDGQTYVPPNAELYFVFNQPTMKSGSFSVADVDSNAEVGGTLLLLNSPRWSSLGDTVYL
ncbi:MAG: hypothetical protein ACM3JJ_04420, partial [Hyphomicrobiales bacterium]